MANKPIIDVQVNAEAFERFVALYNAYSEKLAEQPREWDALNDAMGGAGETLKAGALSGQEALALAATQAELIAYHLKDAGKAQVSFARTTAAHTKGFVDLGRAGKGAFTAIGGAADASIAKVGAGFAGMASSAAAALGPVGLAVGAIAAVVGGAGAALKGLADAAVTRQRSAFGMGITPGQEASFQVNAQQFIGRGELAAAAHAQLNLGNVGALSLLGIDFEKARKTSASDLAFQMLQGATRAAQAMPELPLENIPGVQAYKSLGGDVEAVRNALQMGLPALDQARSEAARNTGRFELNRKAVDESAKFKIAVEGAGIAIQSGAINKLSGADPAIAAILNAITGDKQAASTVASGFKRIGDTISHAVDPALKALQAGASRAAAALQNIGHLLTSPIDARAAAANALGAIEGTWTSVNKDSGALGRWQFMPTTADAHLSAEWKKKFGSTTTARGRENFLGSPKAQTDAFNSYYEELRSHAAKRTKDPQKIMRMIALGWYGGEGSWNETEAQLNAPQWYGGHAYPSQNSYADKFERLVAEQMAHAAKPVPPKASAPKTAETQFSKLANWAIDQAAKVEFSRIAQLHPGWKAEQVAQEATAEHPGNAAWARDIGNILLRAQRAARSSKPGVKVSVTNSTAANVAVSANAGAQV